MRYLNLLALLCLAIPQITNAETMYINTHQAKVHTKPGMAAPVLVTLTKGNAVEVTEKQKRWIKISTGQHKGWVSKLLLKKTRPLKSISIIEDNQQDLKVKARRRASTNASSAATRGLRNDERARRSDQDAINFSAVERMKEMSVSDSEAKAFMESNLAD